MILIQKPMKLSLSEAKIPYNLVKAVRDVAKNPTKIYDISKLWVGSAEMKLMSLSHYNAMLGALNPALSLPVLINNLTIDITQAALRMEELYHLVAGLSYYPGSDPNAPSLGVTGVEKKLRLEGRQLADLVTTKVSSGGAVIANYPIDSSESVSARKPGGALTVTTVDLQLGVVSLEDTGLPIADGVTVELVCQSIRHCVYALDDLSGSPKAVILSKELFNYLVANV
jgi:hypothetical protein